MAVIWNDDQNKHKMFCQSKLLEFVEGFIDVLEYLPLIRIAIFSVVLCGVTAFIYPDIGVTKGLLYLIPMAIFAKIASFILVSLVENISKLCGVLFVISIESKFLASAVNYLLMNQENMIKLRTLLVTIFVNINYYGLCIAAICFLIRVFKALFL